MTITTVETTLLAVPRSRPFMAGDQAWSSADTVLATVTDDSGETGIGYAWAPGQHHARAIRAHIQEFSPLLVGADARDPETLWTRLWSASLFFGAGSATMAIGALDSAIWDLKGKLLSTPLHQMLGVKRLTVPVYASGLFLADGPASLAKEAAAYAQQGFRAVKMKVGRPSLADDIACVAAVREAIGPGTVLYVDAIQRWSFDSAIAFVRRAEPFDVSWIEDPLSYEDVPNISRLTTSIAVPVTIGEFASPWQLERLLESEAMDIAMLDLQRLGGVTGWRKVAAKVAARRMPVTSHIFVEASGPLVASCETGMVVEYLPWWEAIFEGSPQIQQGEMVLSHRAGIGVSLKEDALERYSIP